jgi:hypothetical protein
MRFNKLMCIWLEVCLVGILLTGCKEETITILPNLILSVTTLDFGSVTISTASLIQTVTLNNPNERSVTVERVTTTNGAFQIGGYYSETGELTPLIVPFTIPNTAASTLYIRFYPTETTDYTGKLVIESVDANARTETSLVDLEGIGIPVPEPTPTPQP